MNTKDKKQVLSFLGQDLISHKRSVLAKSAHQSLVLELIHNYGLSLEKIHNETQIAFKRLSFLAAGTLDALDLSDYIKLLCFYCYQENHSSSKSNNKSQTQVKIAQTDQPVNDFSTIQEAKENNGKYLIQGIHLTKREHQIALLLLRDEKFTYKEIGKKMNLSPRTIEFYTSQLRLKLNASSRWVLKSRLKLFLKKPD